MSIFGQVIDQIQKQQMWTKQQKIYFVPLHKHSLYAQFKQILVCFKDRKYSLDNIITSLSIFNYLSKHYNPPVKSQSYLQQQIKKFFKLIKQCIYGEHNEIQVDFKSIFKENIQQYIEEYRELRTYRQEVIDIFENIARYVLDFQNQSKHVQKIGISLSKKNDSLQLDRSQVVYIMCLMALNLVPTQQYHKIQRLSNNFHRNNNFSIIFNHQSYKTRTIIQYFRMVFNENNYDYQKFFKQSFIIKRQVVNDEVCQLIEQNQNLLMKEFHILPDNHSIEQYVGKAKVDFANKYIGGGSLSRGCVQQQIMYANHPELYVTVILCQSLKNNQSLFYSGFKKYFTNFGYSYNTKYAGKQAHDLYKYTDKQYIIAIDALDFKNNEMSQFNQDKIDRQILKAFSGFKNIGELQDIVSGNWGCGIFKGEIRLKFIIQWIAASLAGKNMFYCPYGSNRLLSQNFRESFLSDWLLKPDRKIKEVYQLLKRASKNIRYSDENIFESMNPQLQISIQNECKYKVQETQNFQILIKRSNMQMRDKHIIQNTDGIQKFKKDKAEQNPYFQLISQFEDKGQNKNLNKQYQNKFQKFGIKVNDIEQQKSTLTSQINQDDLGIVFECQNGQLCEVDTSQNNQKMEIQEPESHIAQVYQLIPKTVISSFQKPFLQDYRQINYISEQQIEI